MKPLICICLTFLISFVCPDFYLLAQEFRLPIEINGQIRLRHEQDNRDFNSKTNDYGYTYFRTGLGLKINPEENLFAYIQLQDSRTFGRENLSLNDPTLTHMANVDLHQGYFQINRFIFPGLALKLGRMELEYGSGRLISRNNWNNVGRAFDGGLLTVQFSQWRIELFTTVVNESLSKQDSTSGDLNFSGLWITRTLNKNSSLDFYALFDRSQSKDIKGNSKLFRYTTGSHLKGRKDAWQLELEYNFQRGWENFTRDIFAHYFSALVNYTFAKLGHLSLSVGYDYLSGDDPDSPEFECFTTLFASRHRYFGYMNYFKDIPKDTRDLGLSDLQFKISLKPLRNTIIKLDGHFFRLSRAAQLDSGQQSRTLGKEIDLESIVKYSQAIEFRFGASLFKPAEVFKNWKGEDLATWFFIQTTFDI